MTPARPPAFAPDQPVDAALAALRSRLAAHGVASAGLDARCLVEAARGEDRASLVAHGGQPLGQAAAATLSALAARRLAGEPLARILGEREFWGLRFALSPAALVPRPETETLVEAALRHCIDCHGRDHAWRILDLGTGSGCIAIALLTELPHATAVGVDRSGAALATARANADRLGVGARLRLVAGDWGRALDGVFDLAVSNPPYIAAGDIATLAAEVRDHDPRRALDGGRDGLDAYRAIAGDLPRLLVPDGAAFLEIGAGQEAAVNALLRAAGLSSGPAHSDLAGRARVVPAMHPAKLRREPPASDIRGSALERRARIS